MISQLKKNAKCENVTKLKPDQVVGFFQPENHNSNVCAIFEHIVNEFCVFFSNKKNQRIVVVYSIRFVQERHWEKKNST